MSSSIPQRISAVLLDFDGVVADSVGQHLACWTQALAETFAGRTLDMAQFVGTPGPRIAELVANQLGAASRAGELYRRKTALLREIDPTTVPLMPGAEQFISALRALEAPFAIGSNAPEHFVRDVTVARGLGSMVIVTPHREIRRKPHPDVYLRCLDLLGLPRLSRSSSIVFDDTPHGVAGGAAAGMHVIGIATSATIGSSLRAAGARATHRHLGEVLDSPWWKAVQIVRPNQP